MAKSSVSKNFDSPIFRVLEERGSISRTTNFSIDSKLLTEYMEEYSRLNGGGWVTKSREVRYNAKLTALGLLKYKRKHSLPLTEGFVYVIVNPSWPNYYKIGMSSFPLERLAQYQTYSPLRDYKLLHWSYHEDKRVGERIAHISMGDSMEKEWVCLEKQEITKLCEKLNSFSDTKDVARLVLKSTLAI